MNIIDDDFINQLNNVKVISKKLAFFDVISPKEIIVSEWLSFILDPSRNGVGNVPIVKLLNAINVNYDLDSYEFISTELEVSTDSGRRMDIVIKYQGLWIIIENKLDSLENDDQTVDYYNYIKRIKKNNKAICIYLKPNYNKSEPKESKFITLTYGKLLSKLKEINEFEYNEKEKYKYRYLKEFILSGERFMRKEALEYNEAIQFYINNKDKMEYIEREYRTQNRRLHEKLRYDILNIINENREDYVTDDKTSIAPRDYIQYYQNHWYREKYNLHFELMFPSASILAKDIKCDIVLHIEGKDPTEVMEKLKKYHIDKTKSLARIDNESIKTTIIVDFSSEKNYQKSVANIQKELLKLIAKYEGIINKVIS